MVTWKNSHGDAGDRTDEVWLSENEVALALHALRQYATFKANETSENTLLLISKLEGHLFASEPKVDLG